MLLILYTLPCAIYMKCYIYANSCQREQTRKHTDSPRIQQRQTKRELLESLSVSYMSPPLCHGLSFFYSFILSISVVHSCVYVYICVCIYICLSLTNVYSLSVSYI